MRTLVSSATTRGSRVACLPDEPPLCGMPPRLIALDATSTGCAARWPFDRRDFLARTVRLLGHAGQRGTERKPGWNRTTPRKGLHVFRSGIPCADAFRLRGRPRAEEGLPGLLDDIRVAYFAKSALTSDFIADVLEMWCAGAGSRSGSRRTRRGRGSTRWSSWLTRRKTRGVRLTKREMEALEGQIERLPGLEKWFVTFSAPSAQLG